MALALAATCASAGAQSYPAKPISLYVAFGPGGAGAKVAPRVAPKISESQGPPVVKEKRPAPQVGRQPLGASLRSGGRL